MAQNYVSPERVDRNMFVAGSLSDGQTKSPASPGQIVILWGLGLGAIAALDNEAPGAIDLRSQIDVKVVVGDSDAILAGNPDHRLTPAPHKLRGLGGSTVGLFEADLTVPEFLKWTPSRRWIVTPPSR